MKKTFRWEILAVAAVALVGCVCLWLGTRPAERVGQLLEAPRQGETLGVCNLGYWPEGQKDRKFRSLYGGEAEKVWEELSAFQVKSGGRQQGMRAEGGLYEISLGYGTQGEVERYAGALYLSRSNRVYREEKDGFQEYLIEDTQAWEALWGELERLREEG